MIVCPQCSHADSKVIDTRSSGSGIRRRRQCLECGNRFNTYEQAEVRLPMVVKKDGTREAFERDKVLAGLRLACRKRPVSAEALEQAAARVERTLVGAGSEVPAERIGRLVLRELRGLDVVAYVRFASVYLELDKPTDFLELLEPWLEVDSGRLKVVEGSGVEATPEPA